MNATARDFRLVKCITNPDCFQPVLWWSEELEDQGNGVYVATRPPPGRGMNSLTLDENYRMDWISN